MTLTLSGELICDEWAQVYRWFGFEDGWYCPGDIRAAIAGLTAGEELTLEINSVGGDVFAASEIYALLEGCPNLTRAVIQSLAASAASYYPLSCDRVEMALSAQMMIHCAGWDVGGNKTDHRWAADQLEVTDSTILDVYSRKCGQKATRDQLEALMEGETYLSARQCLELGLVDAILGEDAPAEGEPLAQVASATGNLIRAMRTRPDIRILMERRASELQAARDALDLEKHRYPRA